MIARNAQRLTAVKPPRRPAAPPPAKRQRPRHRPGLSLVEMLISLAITAVLLTATMVAIDASFKAYAAAAETASAQASARMVVNRLLMLVRTSIAVGGDESPADNKPYITVVSQAGDYEIRYEPETKTLYLITDEDETTKQPLLENVQRCAFTLHREPDDDSPAGILEVVRATIDLEVVWDDDNTLSVEGDRVAPIRAIASTMPRRIN